MWLSLNFYDATKVYKPEVVKAITDDGYAISICNYNVPFDKDATINPEKLIKLVNSLNTPGRYIEKLELMHL